MYSNDDNPFRAYRDYLSQLIARFDPEKPNGWNMFFDNKPTDAQIIDWLDINEIKCDNNSILRKQRLARKKHGELECYLITFSFDKCLEPNKENVKNLTLNDIHNHSRIKQNMMKLLDTFRNTNYKWCNDPVAVCEFNTKTGFNPHIHIVCKKNYESSMKCSGIQQGLRRKFKPEHIKYSSKSKCNYEIYNVNVIKIPVSAGEDYVNGLKQDNKQEYLDKDKLYREEFGYDHLYSLY